MTSVRQSVCPGYRQRGPEDGQGKGLPVPRWSTRARMLSLPQGRNCCCTSHIGFWGDFLAPFGWRPSWHRDASALPSSGPSAGTPEHHQPSQHCSLPLLCRTEVLLGELGMNKSDLLAQPCTTSKSINHRRGGDTGLDPAGSESRYNYTPYAAQSGCAASPHPLLHFLSLLVCLLGHPSIYQQQQGLATQNFPWGRSSGIQWPSRETLESCSEPVSSHNLTYHRCPFPFPRKSDLFQSL